MSAALPAGAGAGASAGRPAPRVVALGGGHGQAVTLCAARRYAREITAVVSVADDGGSSGRLRRQLGIAPPGDLRKCLVALAARDSVLARAFEHRFDPVLEICSATPDEPGLGGEAGAAEGSPVGHALGNLLLAGLAGATGSLQAALDEAGRLLGTVGRVVPAATEPVVLKADADGGPVEGQTAVMRTGQIRRVSLVPADPAAPAEALAAIGRADQIILGPGSLFTSVLAAAVVPAVAAALRATRARRVYVANLRPQAAETEGYDVAAHLAALAAHGITVDDVLCDTAAIELGDVAGAMPGVRVEQRDLARANGMAHDPSRLASALAVLVG